MSTERWERTKQILDEALRLALESRQSYLDLACGADRELRAEVESLLAAHEDAGSQFLLSPAADALHFSPSGDPPPPLQQIGHYCLIAEIGHGGMGVVFRAEDMVLSRQVAMKFLPAEFASERTAFERLQREARAASALDHPNICSIYELGEHEGRPFIVMQLLDGQTLREWIAALVADESSRLRRCLVLAVQIAEGLQAAHEKGIIHRDIKPANIFVTTRGDAKILDFGLAKVLADQATAFPLDAAAATSTGPNPTLSTVQLTRTGTVMGTAAYMAPEQIRGENIDARADVFSFGLVLYEMATGQRAFALDSPDHLREAILHTEPRPIRKLNPQLPAELERIVGKALNKDREKRYQSVGDLSAELKKLKMRIESRKAAELLRSRWTFGAASVLVAAVIASGLYYRSLLTQPGLRDPVVLADFTGSTGDKAFDSTLKQALSTTINQSPGLNVIADEKVTWTLQKMVRPADTALVPEVAREVCQRANIRSYIAGSVTPVGDQYIVGLKAMNCRSGDVLAQEQATASSKQRVLAALDSAAVKLRSELAASLAKLPKLDIPLEDVTTSSLQALEAFSTGVRVEREKGPAEALPFFQRAIELDPTFVAAYSGVGNDYSNLGEATRAAEYFSKAFQLRDRVSRRENLSATADYYTYATGELEQAAQAYRNLIANYPRIWGPHIGLGNVYTNQGLYAKALDEFHEAERMGNDNNYENIANMALALQQFDDASKAVQEAQARKVGGYVQHLQLYVLSFFKSDRKGMDDQEQWFAGHPDVAHDGLALASDTEAYFGHLSKSRQLTRQSVQSALRADSKEAGAIWYENAALREAAFGNTIEATQLAAEGLKLLPESQGVQMEAALAYALIGDTSRPASLMQQLEERYPLDTQVHALWLSPIRAQLALERHNPSAALAALPDIGALEFGQISFLNNLSCLYPAYIRGNAYLAVGQGAPAAAEFQKILDHSGIVWNCWTGALARLGLARANALQAKASQGVSGDTARARALTAYKDFLTLWQDADLDIPILKDAKAEYAKLQ